MDAERRDRFLCLSFLERCAVLRSQLCGRRYDQRCQLDMAAKLTSHRWRPCHYIRLSGLCYPRYATTLRGGPVVLGSRSRQSAGHCFRRRKPQLVSKNHHTARPCCRMSDVGHRRDTTHGFAPVLSPDTWQYSIILLFTIPAENNYGRLSSFPVATAYLWLTLGYSGSSSSW